MTPLQAAKAYCANYQPDGSCLGIYYNDDLSIDPQRYEPLPKCLIADCQACPYYEEIVLPQVSPSVAASYRSSLSPDTKTSVKPRQAIKLCLDCHKREVERRKRYCATCARIRKRKADSQHIRAKRGLDVGKTADSPIGAEALTNA